MKEQDLYTWLESEPELKAIFDASIEKHYGPGVTAQEAFARDKEIGTQFGVSSYTVAQIRIAVAGETSSKGAKG